MNVLRHPANGLMLPFQNASIGGSGASFLFGMFHGLVLASDLLILLHDGVDRGAREQEKVMNNRRWLGQFWRNRRGIVVHAVVAIGCVLFVCEGSVALAQERTKPKPFANHVEELARYLDRVEIYSPVVYRQLAVFPVRLRDGDKLRGSWLTMDQAISRGVLIVTEKMGGGRVPVVGVENTSRNHTVFIMSGEVLAGGKQSRTVRKDVVLAPGQKIDLNVFCVEERRWQGKAGFTTGNTLLPQSIRKELRKGADQSKVWQEIARNNMALGAVNATGSLELALNADRVKRQLAEVRGKIVPEMPRDTVGYIFVHHGRAVGADFFGRQDLAPALLPKLLDAYAVDFILQYKSAAPAQRRVDGQTAIAFFQKIKSAGSTRSTTPGSGAGISTRSRGLLGDGVSLGDVVVHYGVQIQDRIIPLPKPMPPIQQR